jgi:hypothetical protein
MSDVLTSRDVNEIAETEPGAVRSAVTKIQSQENARMAPKISVRPAPSGSTMTALSVATIGPDGTVQFESTDDFKSLKQ